MKPTFSDSDILRFLFDEMPPAQSEAFLDALTQDSDLWERYDALQASMDMAEGLSFDPTAASLNAVLAEVHGSEMATDFESEAAAETSTLAPNPASSKLLRWTQFSVASTAVLATLLLFLLVGRNHSPQDATPFAVQEQPLPTMELHHEVHMEIPEAPAFEWDDQRVNQRIERINEKIEGLDTPLL